MQVSAHVSAISAIPEVRKKLVRLQQRLAENGGTVMDGRDIGTVVLPSAEVKIFMTASPAVRAERRFKQLMLNGVHSTLEEVSANLSQRDLMDTTRVADPLVQAPDALVLDNTYLTEEEQFSFVLQHARKAILTKVSATTE
jgi:cytidylate kinase